MNETVKVIDIEKEIRNSKSGLLKSLPHFLIKRIEKFIRQDEMNAAINGNRDKTGVPFLNDVLNDWNVIVKIHGEENIPPSGRFVFAANHPLGIIDAMAFFNLIYKFFPEVITPSNELLYRIPNLQSVLLGINVFGKNSRGTAEKLNELYESDTQVMMFPSGEVSRRKKGRISDPEWQKSFITKAVQSKRDIIPVHISGRNSNLFYTVANLRKFLGIKMYIETTMLPREMIKQCNSSVTLTIGRVIPSKTFTKEKSHWEWAQVVKEIVNKLPDEN
jgi:1-acyl-sn-glycerol-3-phosphate acyltransferase